jgi:hypothetical protein
VAGKSKGPVLLVDTDAIPDVVRTELRRLSTREDRRARWPGDDLQHGVESQLDAYTTGAVERWSGPDRFSTSAMISQRSYPTGVGTAYIASGRVFTDALSGAPVAGKNRRAGAPRRHQLRFPATSPMSWCGSVPAASWCSVARRRSPPPSFARLARRMPRRPSGGPEMIASPPPWRSRHKSYSPGVGRSTSPPGASTPTRSPGAPVAGMTAGPVLLVDTTSIPSAVGAEIALPAARSAS